MSNKISFEQQLFKAADKLRKNIDAAEYKYVVLGLVFIVISAASASGIGSMFYGVAGTALSHSF